MNRALEGAKRLIILPLQFTVYIKTCSSLTHNKIVPQNFVVLQNMLGIINLLKRRLNISRISYVLMHKLG
jgi:hypothetical protein